MPVKIIISIWPLFAGLSLIGLAVGVQGSLLGVRAELEGFDDYLIALLMSCYFAGYMIGSRLTHGSPRYTALLGNVDIDGLRSLHGKHGRCTLADANGVPVTSLAAHACGGCARGRASAGACRC